MNGPILFREKYETGFDFFQPQKLLDTIKYNPNIYIIK